MTGVGVWLSYNDIDLEGNFTWGASGCNSTYENWNTDQPDNTEYDPLSATLLELSLIRPPVIMSTVWSCARMVDGTVKPF